MPEYEYEDRAKLTTSIQVPIWLAQQIKAAGMTYNGAMVAGWNAMQERREANQQISDLRQELKETRENMIKYRDRWLDMKNAEVQ